jgi:hypothetical protein
MALAALLAASAPARAQPAFDNPQAFAPPQGEAVSPTSQQELKALTYKLGRLWNPNCAADAPAGVVVRVRVRLTQNGRLESAPMLIERTGGTDPELQARASQRALSALERGQPYVELKPEHYASWRELVITFNARQACEKS